jgi:HEAT repeat protein
VAEFALSEIGSPAVVPLIGTFQDANPHVRGAAALALGRIGLCEEFVFFIAAEPHSTLTTEFTGPSYDDLI